MDRFHFAPAQSLEDEQLFDLAPLSRTIACEQDQGLALADGATVHTANRNPSHERGIIQGGNLHLQGPRVGNGRRNMGQNGIHQRRKVLAHGFPIVAHPTLFGGTVHGREIQLLFVGPQVEEQFKNSIVHLVRAAIFLVHLVDDDDGMQAQFQGLAQHKSGLGHGPFEGIHQ